MNGRTRRTAMHWIHAAALTICLVLATTGCAADNDKTADADQTAATLTRAEYIEQADAICLQGNAALEAAASEFFADKPDPTAEQERTYATTVFVPNLERQIAELRKLQVPEGDEDEVTAIYDAAASGLDEISADPSTFGGEPPAGFRETSRLSAEYGFKVCGGT